jgi:hypothetical protein
MTRVDPARPTCFLRTWVELHSPSTADCVSNVTGGGIKVYNLNFRWRGGSPWKRWYDSLRRGGRLHWQMCASHSLYMGLMPRMMISTCFSCTGGMFMAAEQHLSILCQLCTTVAVGCNASDWNVVLASRSVCSPLGSCLVDIDQHSPFSGRNVLTMVLCTLPGSCFRLL